MDAPASHNEKSVRHRLALNFATHIFIVYGCALFIVPGLILAWFSIVAPRLQILTGEPGEQWYAHHFVLAMTVPGLMLGYIGSELRLRVKTSSTMGSISDNPTGVWVWTIPTAILLVSFIVFRGPSSVLIGTLIPLRKYFFEILDPRSDPVRVSLQTCVTAPFYCGLAYTLGSWLGTYDLIAKLSHFLKSPNLAASEGTNEPKNND